MRGVQKVCETETEEWPPGSNYNGWLCFSEAHPSSPPNDSKNNLLKIILTNKKRSIKIGIKKQNLAWGSKGLTVAQKGAHCGL